MPLIWIGVGFDFFVIAGFDGVLLDILEDSALADVFGVC
jgi:hypothetical protein